MATGYSFRHSPTGNPLKIEFDASPVSPKGAVEYEWHFGHGDAETHHRPNVTHEFPAPGSYEVTLVIKRPDGEEEGFMEQVTVAPTFTASPTSGDAPLQVDFKVEQPDSNLSYEWDFGDGSDPAFGTETQQTFEKAGDFNVTLIAKANDGTSRSFPQPIKVTGGNIMPKRLPIIFTDMKSREERERKRLENRLFELTQAKEKAPGKKLPPKLEEEIKTIEKLLGLSNVVDPLFVGVRDTLMTICEEDWPDHPDKFQHVDGKLPSQQTDPPDDDLKHHEKILAGVFGILGRDSKTPKQTPYGAGQPVIDPRFKRDVSIAQGEYVASKPLFLKVLAELIRQGEQDDGYRVRADLWVAVVRKLKSDSVGADDDHLGLKIRFALAKVQGASDGAPMSAIDIDLPDLEEQADVEIVVDNLHAMQALYYAASLEELKVFQVVDKLVELFQHGYLPLGKGFAGDGLYKYWKESIDRLSEIERRNLYARCFGFPGGAAEEGSPNREFESLWMRFISAVSSFVRQFEVNNLITRSIPLPVSQEQVRKSGRDLAANLSLHGYGIAYFAATELQQQIKEVIALLSSDDIKLAYGARDMWQVVDQVATLELGGARNSIRYRTMANAGAIIVRWLAKNHRDLLAIGTNVIDPAAVRDFNLRPDGVKATVDPTDYDLANACEQWLAVNGIPDQEIEDFAQPIESPFVTSRPVQMPAAVQDALSSVGIPMGIGRGHGVPQMNRVGPNGHGNGYGN